MILESIILHFECNGYGDSKKKGYARENALCAKASSPLNRLDINEKMGRKSCSEQPEITDSCPTSFFSFPRYVLGLDNASRKASRNDLLVCSNFLLTYNGHTFDVQINKSFVSNNPTTLQQTKTPINFCSNKAPRKQFLKFVIRQRTLFDN